MIKIIKKSTYESLLEKQDHLLEQNQNLTNALDDMEQEVFELRQTLNAINEANSREISVTISFDDTLQKATPIVKYKPDVADQLIQLNIINSSSADKYGVELALLNMTEEVLAQILDSFREEFEEV